MFPGFTKKYHAKNYRDRIDHPRWGYRGYGSATLVRALLQHGLIDELRLMVHPLAVGGGLRLFDDKGSYRKFLRRV